MQKNIKKLFTANLLGGLYFHIPIFTLFLINNDITLPAILYSQMIYSVSALLAEIPTGVIADRFGHNLSVAIGYLVDAMAILLIGLFPSLYMLFAIQLIRGIANGFMSGSKEALLFEYSSRLKQDYKKNLSHLVSYQLLGFAVSTLLTGLLVQKLQQDAYLPAILITVAMVLSAALITFTTGRPVKNKRIVRPKLYEIKKSFMLFKKSKLLKTIFIVIGLTQTGKYIVMDLYQPYFELQQVLPLFLGAALSVGSLASFLIIRNVYKIEKILKNTALALAFITITTGICYVAFGLFRGPLITVALFILIFSLVDAVAIFISDYTNSQTTSDVRATVLSGVSLTQELFKTATKALFALALGVLTLPQLFTLYGIYLIIGAVICYYLLKKVVRLSNFNNQNPN